MNRMMQLLQIVGVIVLCSAFFPLTPSRGVDASVVVMPRLSCMNSTGITYSSELSWRSHEAMRANSEMELLPQGAGVQYFIMLLLLCMAEEEACFDVCGDQAEELADSGELSGQESGEFLQQCNAACWNECFEGEETH